MRRAIWAMGAAAVLAARPAMGEAWPAGYSAGAAEFTYSVPAATQEGRRAYLWVPADCRRVRGLLFVINNMLEERVTADPVIRQAAADCGLGIVWVQPGSDGRSPVTLTPGKGAAAAVRQILADLAAESGYAEIAHAPLILEEHSACSPFVFGMQGQMPEQIIAAIPLKGFNSWGIARGVPNLKVLSEWAEHGAGWRQPWNPKWFADDATGFRNAGADVLVGDFMDISSGHFDFTPTSAPVLAMFIRKAVAARLPAGAPMDGPVPLRTIDPNAGVLVDPLSLGTVDFKAVPVARWVGDPKKALWYFDAEMARTCNYYLAAELRKRPQMIQPIIGGKPVVLDKTGLGDLHPTFEADGVTFRVAAGYYDRSPAADLYGGGPLGHQPEPVGFRVGSGAIDQVGPDTFRVGLHRGVILNQGNPWEPWVIAHADGDATYRRTDRPIHVSVDIVSRNGAPQTLEFPPVSNVPAGTATVPLAATASSGLPASYFMVSGPAEVAADGKGLKLLPIPPRSKYPVRVRVAAFQWGRATGTRVRSAGPIVREFFIQRPAGG